MTVRLTKKLADVVNGLDISFCTEGDVIELSRRHAAMLLAEGWAEEVAPGTGTTCVATRQGDTRAVAAERPRRRSSRERERDDLVQRLGMAQRSPLDAAAPRPPLLAPTKAPR